MFIINMFHINIRNFHNNDRLNKTALTILSQLKIIKVNIIENFGKENNRITTENERILKWKKSRKKKKERERSFFIVHFVYRNGLPIVALTLKVLDKYNQYLIKMAKTKPLLKNMENNLYCVNFCCCRWGGDCI